MTAWTSAISPGAIFVNNIFIMQKMRKAKRSIEV